MPADIIGVRSLCYILSVGRRVLVTEADGHLGQGLVEHLIGNGYEVSAGIRRAADERRVAPLRILGAKIVGLDVARPDKLAPAMAGIDGVFHTAPAREPAAKRAEAEIGTTPVEGMLNVLAAARDGGVKRIVFTSDSPIAKRFEPRAWEFTRANDMDMVAITPSTIIGPGFHRHSPSTETIEHILRGDLPALPPINASYVDVRDVAELHRLAFERSQAQARYSAPGAYTPIEELARLIQELVPSIRVPRRRLPLCMLRSMAAIDSFKHRLFGCRRRFSAELLAELDGGPASETDGKAADDLGWSQRPLSETLADTLTWIRQRFLSGH